MKILSVPPFTLRQAQGERGNGYEKEKPFVLSLSKHEPPMARLNCDSILPVQFLYQFKKDLRAFTQADKREALVGAVNATRIVLGEG